MILLQHDPTNAKALYRRGIARLALEQRAGAVEDLRGAQKHLPGVQGTQPGPSGARCGRLSRPGGRPP